ncbi:MAG: MFS transporter [Bacteroidales bacterium]|nr:MFS transporter [Bacteroidales bacterium]
MILKDEKTFGAFRYTGKGIARILYMGRVVWQAISSCFGSGAWIEDYPWLDEDGWKNE